MPAEFLCNLTKNPTTHLTHKLCAGLPNTSSKHKSDKNSRTGMEDPPVRLLCFCGIFAGCCRYFDDGMTRAIAPAMLEMGMVWSQMRPDRKSTRLNSSH